MTLKHSLLPPILAYHSILPEPNGPLELHPIAFKDQLSWLRDNGFEVISLEDYVLGPGGVKSSRPCVVLTFDDGYTNFVDHALPVLEAYNFTATIFLVTGKLGRMSDWHRFSKSHRMLSLPEIESLRQYGYRFGSHTVNHIKLTEAPYVQAQFELSDSLSFIKEIVGESFLPLSYPFGAAGRREFSAARKVGYDCACVVKNTGVPKDNRLFGLERIEIHSNQGLDQFESLIQGRAGLRVGLTSIMSKATTVFTSVKRQRTSRSTTHTQDIERWIGPTVARTDQWFDTMRGPRGYSGPVPHWWRSSLLYAGSGLDWRYEGIILGYLSLFHKTGQVLWLEKAEIAGKDLVHGILDSGNFAASGFEMNPSSQDRTPHEAACDLGLLELASALKELGRTSWEMYFQVAQKNLDNIAFSTLWDRKAKYFWNAPDDATFVPNKAATIVEAILSSNRVIPNEEIIAEYVIPTLDKIVACQVSLPGSPLGGAIDQSMREGKGLERYFPFYIARCIPALVSGFLLTEDKRYLRSAKAAMEFILRYQLEDGSFPQVIYGNLRVNRFPQWVAGTGDILHAMELLQGQGMEIDLQPTLDWLLKGQLPSGGFHTARGFGSVVSQNRAVTDDFRDLLPTCGWVDKAFRFLADHLPQNWLPTPVEFEDVELDCVFNGRPALFRETRQYISVVRDRQTLYCWRKGETWAEMR